MIEIKKDTIIGDILDVAPQTAPIFFSIGMHCLGCPSSRGETVEEACAVHGVDVDKLLELVNQEANKAAVDAEGMAALKNLLGENKENNGNDTDSGVCNPEFFLNTHIEKRGHNFPKL